MNRIKAILSISLLSILVLLLYSCEMNHTNPQIANCSTDMESDLLPDSGNQLELLSSIDYKEISVATADTGFYEIVLGEKGYNIKYTDYTTNSRLYLCNRPECMHSDETCTSWLNFIAQPFIVDDTLFLYKWPQPWNEEEGVIEKRKLDGLVTEELYRLRSNEEIISAFVTDKTNLFFIVWRTEKHGTEVLNYYELRSVNIYTHNCEVVYTFDSHPMSLAGVVNNQIVFKSFNDIVNNGIIDTEHTDYLFDIKTKELTKAWSWLQSQEYGTIRNNNLYIINYDNNSLSCINLLTKDETVIMENMELKHPETASIIHINNDKFIILAYEEADNIYGEIACYFIVDARTKRIEKLNFTYPDTNGVATPMKIIAATDSEYILLAGFEKSSFTAYDKAGNPYESYVDDPIYAKISFDNFYNNKSDQLIYITN